MKCKECKNTIEEEQIGLDDFCSIKCQKAYNRTYRRRIARERRKVKKTGNTINSEKVTPITLTVSTPLDAQKTQPVTLYDSFGGKRWYDMAHKYCSNFYIRNRGEKCITLAVPYYLFGCECKDCTLGKTLMLKYGHLVE